MLVNKNLVCCSAGAFEAIVNESEFAELTTVPLAGIESIIIVLLFTVAYELNEVRTTDTLFAVDNPLFLNDG